MVAKSRTSVQTSISRQFSSIDNQIIWLQIMPIVAIELREDM